MFLEAHARAPNEIILDLDATDDPVHGEQEGRFFHGYYDCYCYLPLYVFCGRHLLAAKLRPASMDAAAGAVEEVFVFCWRADSGFARDELMAWCEANGVHFLFGLAKNDRLTTRLQASWRRPREEPADRQAGTLLQGLHVDDAPQLEPAAAGGRQGRVHQGRSQSPLRRHFADARRVQTKIPLREALLCPR